MCLMVKSKFSLWNTHSASPVLALLHCILDCLTQTITARPGLNGAIVWPVVTPQCPGWLLWSPAQLSVGHYYKYWATLGGEVSAPTLIHTFTQKLQVRLSVRAWNEGYANDPEDFTITENAPTWDTDAKIITNRPFSVIVKASQTLIWSSN